MKDIVKGLVIREVKYAEADRIITIFSPEKGIISAIAKGGLRPKNKLFSATGLFCYSEFTLFEGKNMFKINEATPLELFFGLRSDVFAVAVATYIAELIQILSPIGTEAEKLLRLALNSFYVMSEKKVDPCLVKAVFELRGLAESGFMPNLIACAECGCFEKTNFYFSAHAGAIYCEKCAENMGFEANIGAGVLEAMRHIVLCEQGRQYRFTLKETAILQLCNVCESYTLHNLDYPPKSLEFLKALTVF